jgi:NADH:ubiquinone reductase (non-electrogenic)
MLEEPSAVLSNSEVLCSCQRRSDLSIGGTSAIVELGDTNKPHFSMTGFKSWVAWRSAYLTRLGNMRNRLYVAFNWTLTLLLGRDMSSW